MSNNWRRTLRNKIMRAKEQPALNKNFRDKEAIKRMIRKIISIGRAGLEIYFAAKRKDPIYLGMGLLSTYEAVDSLLEKEALNVYGKLYKMGLARVEPGLEKLIFSTLLDLEIPNSVLMSDKNSDSESKVLLFNIYESKFYAVMEGGVICAMFTDNYEKFIDSFSTLLKEKIGEFVSIGIYNENYNTIVKLYSIDISLENYISPINEEEYCNTVNKFKSMGLSRSSLLFGPPGSGKTSFAAKIARQLGGRLIVIDARALQLVNQYGWGLILQKILKLTSPTVVLFDDIDRLGEYDLGSLLSLIENLNREIGKNAIIMASVNDICALPLALRRPGRFDEIKLFDYPAPDHRKNIIQTYIKHFGSRLADKYVDEIVELSDNLTPAYLREIALQATIQPYEQIPNLIKYIKKMIGISREDMDMDDGPEIDFGANPIPSEQEVAIISARDYDKFVNGNSKLRKYFKKW